MTVKGPFDNFPSYEATIVVEGVELSFGEAMTLRVALSNWLSDLARNGLGDNAHGRLMTEAYLTHGRKIENLIFAACNEPRRLAALKAAVDTAVAQDMKNEKAKR